MTRKRLIRRKKQPTFFTNIAGSVQSNKYTRNVLDFAQIFQA